ncbi:signal recognition particle subunit [Naganishia albida]|nr:signal recognition particle subunit [Naganishia albida]
MPSVEEVFDDDTDFPLPDTPGHAPGGSYLRNTGTQGALLEEITDDDVDAVADAAGAYDMDMDRVAEQSRGFGDNVGRPKAAPPSRQTLASTSSSSSDLRPSGNPMPQQGGPMGGIMGDFLKMQQAEEARMKKLEQQLGSGMMMKDQQEFKAWNTLYPLYFDAKLSVNEGRRVPRSKALWWPQSLHIAKACSALGLQCVHEIEKTHPADWRNPGRVKVLLKKDNQFAHPIIQNRTQLCNYIATQIQKMNPSLVPKAEELKRSRVEVARGDSGSKQAIPTSVPKGKGSKTSTSGTSTRAQSKAARRRTRNLPPAAPHPFPAMDDRLPINSPAVALGIAVHSVKREIEQEKERKRLGASQGADANNLLGGSEAPIGANKPKMKKIVVRKR